MGHNVAMTNVTWPVNPTPVNHSPAPAGRTTLRRILLALAAVVAVAVLAACGGGDSDDGGNNADQGDQTTTTSEAMAATDMADAFAEPGPFPVGVTTLEIPDGPPVEVWYPAVAGTTGTDTYDLRDYVPDAIRALLTDDADATLTIDAGRDAEAAEGEFPLVVFSHGSAGVRVQSTLLTSHLASWGMVVASPEHNSRNLAASLGGVEADEQTDPVDDLAGTVELMRGQNDSGPLSGRIDLDNIGAVGHSAGGGSVLAFAGTGAVNGYVSMASGARLNDDGEAPELPDVPSFFIAGSTDAVVPADTRTRPAFEAAPTPSLLWIIEGVGHNGFDDFCTFGNGTGIIGVAEASGLGGLLDGLPQLRALGEDGCIPPSVPVADTFPIIHHAVTSWLRSLFGIDNTPVGLGPEVADAYAVPVVIEVKD